MEPNSLDRKADLHHPLAGRPRTKHPRRARVASRMAGRIKRGEGTLIGNAGEFYVAAELLKRGVIAALAPRNAPAVLVNLTPETKDLAFFVVPTPQLSAWLVAEFEKWVCTPGKNGRPHDPSNKKRHLNYPTFENKLAQYLHNWNLMWKRRMKD